MDKDRSKILLGGRTFNSACKLIASDQNLASSLKKQKKEARILMEIEVVIWYEISIASKDAFKVVKSVLRDLMQNDKHSGRKRIIIGEGTPELAYS